MQYLKFQLIKKHTPFHIPPGCLLPPASVQSDSSSHGLCLICFSEITIEISGNIYLFAYAFCFTSKLLLMAFNKRLQWIWKTVSCSLFLILIVTPHICWVQNKISCVGEKKKKRNHHIFAAESLHQPTQKLRGWGSTLNTPMMLHTNTEMEEINLLLRNALHTFQCCMISNLSANELQPLVMVSAPRGRPVSQKSCWLRGKCNTGVKQTW